MTSQGVLVLLAPEGSVLLGVFFQLPTDHELVSDLLSLLEFLRAPFPLSFGTLRYGAHDTFETLRTKERGHPGHFAVNPCWTKCSLRNMILLGNRRWSSAGGTARLRPPQLAPCSKGCLAHPTRLPGPTFDVQPTESPVRAQKVALVPAPVILFRAFSPLTLFLWCTFSPHSTT